VSASTAAEGPVFAFAQFEFPRALGPADGRYLVREGAAGPPERVLVLRTLGAVERRRLTGRRPRTVDPEPDPEPVPTTRATVIEAQSLGGEAPAARWLKAARQSAEAQVTSALAVINRALHAHAIAAADPRVAPASREQALVVRLGWGRGEQVADGRWSEAVEVPPVRGRRQRTDRLRPQERLASLLGGRDHPLAAESLALRARLDLDEGRLREAALQLRLALEAGVAELAGDAAAPSLGTRLGELHGQREAVDTAADEALHGPLAPASSELVSHALARLEAALRARAVAGLNALPEPEPPPRGRGPGPEARPRHRR
jgi:hypothetical protein